MSKPDILLLYTGGTIGMVQEPDGVLHPFNFDELLKQVPELNQIEVNISTRTFEQPIDSSNMQPSTWYRLASIIMEEYEHYDGFVVLHGSDTMAYTASALSFMLRGLGKPVVLTGSQLPIGMIRTDGKENLITSVEVAAHTTDGIPTLQEVAIYFEYKLYRGNRTTKISAAHFNAFDSPNYPVLAEAGVNLHFNERYLLRQNHPQPALFGPPDPSVVVVKIFPGMQQELFEHQLKAPGCKAIILETFGAGNAPSQSWFLDTIEHVIDRGKLVINTSQCLRGRVDMGRYVTSAGMAALGVVSGGDMTLEAALTKTMILLGQGIDKEKLPSAFEQNMAGEAS